MRLFATRHSHTELYVHAVWATKERVRVLQTEWYDELANRTAGTANSLGAALIAFGGTADHVHALLRYRSDLHVAELVRGLKASLTLLIRRDIGTIPDFAWQGGYGAISVSPSDVDRVKSYIGNQERHHADGDIWPEIDLEN